MDNKRKSVIVGLSFVMAIVLFVWGYNFLKGKSLLKEYPYYYAVYQDVNELAPANKVLINGMLVGQVEELFFNPKNDGTIVVKFTASKDARIPRNSVAYITHDLLGSNSIKLVLGDSKVDAQLGDTLVSGSEEGLTDMLATKLMPMKDKLEMLMMSIDTLVVSINSVFDDKMQAEVKTGVSDLSASISNLKGITDDIQNVIDSEKGKISGIVDNIDNIAGNFSSVSDSLAQINYNQIVESLKMTVDNLNDITTNLKNGEGSAGLLLSNDSLYLNVNKTVENLGVLIKKIEENPKKYIRVKVF